jgi:hypothetical protein
MAQCAECGADQDGGSAFCRNCGAPSLDARAEVPAAVEPTPRSPEEPPVLEDLTHVDAEPAETLAVEGTDVEAHPAEAPSRRRRYLAAGGVALALALLCVGLLIGWYVASDRNFATDGKLPSTEAGPTAEPAGPVMPDLRGLGVDNARQVLADVGVGAVTVRTTSQPAAGETGIVLAQQPVFGSAAEGTVQLTISAPATVPQIAGRDATAVLSELEQLGAQVRTTSQYVPGAPVGQIAAIEPKPGSRLTDEVQVVIATAPAEVKLKDIDSVDDGCGTGSGSLNGTAYDEFLTCEADRADPVEQVYVVNRGAEVVHGVLGIPDDADTSSDTSTDMHLDVLADGRVVGSWDVRYGATTSFRANVHAALRITFRVRSNNAKYGTAALADAIIEGDPAHLDPLTQDN